MKEESAALNGAANSQYVIKTFFREIAKLNQMIGSLEAAEADNCLTLAPLKKTTMKMLVSSQSILFITCFLAYFVSAISKPAHKRFYNIPGNQVHKYVQEHVQEQAAAADHHDQAPSSEEVGSDDELDDLVRK